MKSLPISHKYSYKNINSSFFEFLRRERWPILVAMVLAFFYGLIISAVRGNGEWLYVDQVGGHVFYWGDDAYRWFIARSAWINSDIYWFNFTLPGWVFLDGMVVTLSQNDLLYARYIKAVLTAVSVILVYKTSVKLGLRQWTSVAGAFLLATMPLYVFMGMSFYGESWLAFFVTASIYCHVHGYRKLFLLIMALMPLIRPEGVFFVVVFAAIFLYQRRWFEILVLLSGGGLFFISIFIFSEPSSYFGWREEAARVFQAYQANYGWVGGDLLDVFSLPFAISAMAGVLALKSRPLYGFYAGAVWVLLHWGITFSLNRGSFEFRYFSPVVPIFTLAFVAFLDAAYDFFRREKFLERQDRFILTALIAVIFCCQLYSLQTLRTVLWQGMQVGEPFRYLSTNRDREGKLYGLSLQEKAYFREYADVVIKMLRLNPDIKTLIVGNIQVFYFLDPGLMPDHVRVVFSPFTRQILDKSLAGTLAAGYFAEPPYYGYFNLTDPTYEKEKILYLDYFPYADYPYRWQVGGSEISGGNDIFLFGGHFLGMKSSEIIK